MGGSKAGLQIGLFVDDVDVIRDISIALHLLEVEGCLSPTTRSALAEAQRVESLLRSIALKEANSATLRPPAQQHVDSPAGGRKLIPVKTAAQVLGIGPPAVRARIARGRLPAVKHGRRWMVDIER